MKSLFSGNNRDVVFPCKSIIKVSVKIYKYINLMKIVHTCTSYKIVAVYSKSIQKNISKCENKFYMCKYVDVSSEVGNIKKT